MKKPIRFRSTHIAAAALGLVLLASSARATTSLDYYDGPGYDSPISKVPDAGATCGLLALGLTGLCALKRMQKKSD